PGDDPARLVSRGETSAIAIAGRKPEHDRTMAWLRRALGPPAIIAIALGLAGACGESASPSGAAASGSSGDATGGGGGGGGTSVGPGPAKLPCEPGSTPMMDGSCRAAGVDADGAARSVHHWRAPGLARQLR